MKNLQPYDIITLYAFIDDLLPGWPKRTGRRPLLSPSEVLTALLWCSAVVSLKTLKEIHAFLTAYHQPDFPRLSEYSAFVRCCHRSIPDLLRCLQATLAAGRTPLVFCDPTMLEVCRLVRADRHRTVRAIAAFGKNHHDLPPKKWLSLNLCGRSIAETRSMLGRRRNGGWMVEWWSCLLFWDGMSSVCGTRVFLV